MYTFDPIRLIIFNCHSFRSNLYNYKIVSVVTYLTLSFSVNYCLCCNILIQSFD